MWIPSIRIAVQKTTSSRGGTMRFVTLLSVLLLSEAIRPGIITDMRDGVQFVLFLLSVCLLTGDFLEWLAKLEEER